MRFGQPQTTSVPGEPLKHVIDEYRHKAQTVTCVCGWHGSTYSRLGEPSDWTRHVRGFKPTRR